MTQELKSTPFASCYPDGVVEWIDVYGFAVPLTWGDPVAEYNAVRNSAAAMEFSMLLKWDVEGPGAVETVNRIFTRDISDMRDGTIAYGAVVNETGYMLDDCTVFVYGPEHVRVFGGQDHIEVLLKQYAQGSVTITERRDELAQLSVQGPKSREILQALTNTDLSNDAFPYYHFITGVEMAGSAVQVNRMGFTGELGYEVLLPTQGVKAFWDALFKAGEPHGLVVAGAAVVMMCRVEAGMIMGGLEYDDTVSPFECRMGWAVDLDKTDFHGKQALVDLEANPRTAIVSVIVSEEGEYDGQALSIDGTQHGHITMALPSPYLEGKILGLAKVDYAHRKAGTRFNLESGATAEVVPMPVYDPKRVKVKS